MQGRTVTVGLLLLAAGAVGCQRQVRKSPPVALPPSPELVAGQGAFLGGHPAVAIGHFNLFLAQADREGSVAAQTQAYYWLGLCELRLNRSRRALTLFDEVLGLEAPEDVTALALVAAAHAAYRLHAFSRALAYYARLTEPLLPRTPTDEVLYQRALALRRMGRWDDAVSHFRQVASRFPDSPRAADARREAGRPHRYFACQIGWFSKRRNAEGVTKAARRVAFDARVEPGVRNGAPGFAVMVGGYVRFTDAQHAIAQLRRAGFEAFVVP